MSEVIDKDDEVLDYTQGIRRDLANDILKKGIAEVGEDDRKILLTTLQHMDITALGKKRIKVEDKVGTSMAGAAALIAQVLAAPGSGRSHESLTPVQRDAPKLGSDIPDPVLIEGETAVHAAQGDYDSFMARTAPDLSDD